jgi:tetratricopeptide (TPR) repeat protein
MDSVSLLHKALVSHRNGDAPRALLLYKSLLAREPNNLVALEQYSALLLSMGRFGEAAKACGAALAIDPSSQAAASCLGAALRGELTEAAKTGRADDVMNAADRLVDLECGGDPDRAVWERGIFRLLVGDFKTGLGLFEARLRLPDFIGQGRLLRAPRWDGGPYIGKTLLVHGEQGYGDTIMMLRHLKRAKELGGTLMAFVQPPLASLAATCEGPDRVFDSIEGAPIKFDIQLPMMSLPYALGVPVEDAPCPYLCVPGHVPNRDQIDALMQGPGIPAQAEGRGREWPAKPSTAKPGAAKPGAHPRDGRKRRIGLAWAGRPTHKRDNERSIPPEILSPLADILGVSWFALQREGPAPAPATVPFPGATPLGHLLGTFADTAYAIGGLDMIITVDTSMAHLAGAMGVPTMLLVTCLPDWRWLLVRRDSPLYPSIRIYRQKEPGDWKGVIADVAADLSAGRGCGEWEK